MEKEQAEKSLKVVLKAIEDKEVREAVKQILPELKDVLGLNMPIESAIEDEEIQEFKSNARAKGGAYFFEFDGKYCAFKPKSFNRMKEFKNGLSDNASEMEIAQAMYYFFLIKEVSHKDFSDFDSEASYEAMMFLQDAYLTKKGKAL